LLLEDSVLYPEGGGQPWDLGKINSFPVTRVTKPDTVPDHLLPLSSKIVEVEIEGGPIEVGIDAKCEVDWNRRYEFMQQHTAQHLFSAVADELYHADTVGWSMGTDSATVDLASNPLLTNDQLMHIEREVNLKIREGLPVSWKVYSKHDLENAETNPELKTLRGGVKGAALQMEELRLVSIGNVDTNPCGGTHLKSLSEINIFKVVGTEKDRGSIRARFVAGERALSYFQKCIERETSMSTKLSAPSTEHVGIVEKLLKEKKELSKRYDIHSEELAMLWGKSLAGTDEPLIVVHRPGADLKFLVKAATTIAEIQPECLILLSGDENMPAPLGGKPVKIDLRKPISGPMVLFGEVNLVNEIKDQVLQILGGRGGGRPGKLQAQATNLNKLDDVRAILSNVMLSKK
jgi:alanyl-tRNA synthetase